MNRPHQHGDLPEPVRRYWMDLARLEPPAELLDGVVAELENAPRTARFSLLPVAGMMAATAVVVAAVALNLWPAPAPEVGTDRSARPSPSAEPRRPSETLPPGVVPIPDDPPISSVPVLDADVSETDVGRIGSPVLAAHGSVWFGDSRTGQLTRIDAATGEVSAVIDVNPEPATDEWDQLASADDRWVYATGLDETLVQIDPATNEIIRRIPIGTVPYRIELHEGNAYITDLDGGPDAAHDSFGQVTRVDLATGEIVWQVRAGVRPGGLEVTDEAVWVAPYQDAALHRLDPDNGQMIGDYPAYLHGMEILHVSGDALYITGNQERPVERFSISDGRVTARIEEMSGVVIHDNQLYGLRKEGQLVLLDPTTLEWRALAELDAPEGAIVAGEGAVWIATGERLLQVKPNP